MSEKRLEILLSDGESLLAGALGNHSIMGSVHRGKDLVEKINQYLPHQYRIREDIPEGKPYRDGSVVAQAAANMFLHENPDSPLAIFRTAEPEDYFTIAGKMDHIWSDVGLVMYGRPGNNTDVWRHLWEDLEKKGVLPNEETPLLITGAGLKKPVQKASKGTSMGDLLDDNVLQFKYIEGKTRIMEAPGLSTKKEYLNREVHDLDELLAVKRKSSTQYLNERFSSEKPLKFNPFKHEDRYDRGVHVLTWMNKGLTLRPDLADPIELFDGMQTIPVRGAGRLLLRVGPAYE